jgi:hypothetical protein
MRKSGHIIGYFHILSSYLEVIGTANWTATYSHAIYIIHLQSNFPRVSRWITLSVKGAGIGMLAMTLLKMGIAILSGKVKFK